MTVKMIMMMIIIMIKTIACEVKRMINNFTFSPLFAIQ